MAFQAEAQTVDQNVDHNLIPLPTDPYDNLVDLTCPGTMPLNQGETVSMASTDPKGSVNSKNLCNAPSQQSFDSDDNDLSDKDTNVRPLSKTLNVKPPIPLDIGAIGTIFRLLFLGSVEVDEEGGRKRRKRLKKNMVEEAVNKIKVCFCRDIWKLILILKALWASYGVGG